RIAEVLHTRSPGRGLVRTVGPLSLREPVARHAVFSASALLHIAVARTESAGLLGMRFRTTIAVALAAVSRRKSVDTDSCAHRHIPAKSALIRCSATEIPTRAARSVGIRCTERRARRANRIARRFCSHGEQVKFGTVGSHAGQYWPPFTPGSHGSLVNGMLA